MKPTFGNLDTQAHELDAYRLARGSCIIIIITTSGRGDRVTARAVKGRPTRALICLECARAIRDTVVTLKSSGQLQ